MQKSNLTVFCLDRNLKNIKFLRKRMGSGGSCGLQNRWLQFIAVAGSIPAPSANKSSNSSKIV